MKKDDETKIVLPSTDEVEEVEWDGNWNTQRTFLAAIVEIKAGDIKKVKDWLNSQPYFKVRCVKSSLKYLYLTPERPADLEG